MSKSFLIMLISLLMFSSGCATLKIATLTFSGFSYLSTGKSMTDHVISSIKQQDCALHRALQKSEICTEALDVNQVKITAKQDVNDSKTSTLNSITFNEADIHFETTTQDQTVKNEATKASSYIVVGSFINKMFANYRQELLSEFKPHIVKSERFTNDNYRVIIGPVEEKDIAWQSEIIIKSVGIKPWTLQLCNDSLTPPPCNQLILVKNH